MTDRFKDMLADLSYIEEKKRSAYPLDVIDIWGFDSATDEWIVKLGLWGGRGLETIREALTLATESEQLRKENEELKAKLDKAKWQPIDKAPYGYECLCLTEKREVTIDQPRRFCDGIVKACYTHFMPLPDAPEQR